MGVEKYITEELIKKGIDLRSLGTNASAWAYNDVLEILKILEENKVLILGGDVLSKDLSYIGDNWYYNEKDYLASIQHTKKYIDNYYRRNGNDYYYVLVIKDNK